jgi:hypothetical protein
MSDRLVVLVVVDMATIDASFTAAIFSTTSTRIPATHLPRYASIASSLMRLLAATKLKTISHLVALLKKCDGRLMGLRK